MISVQQNADQLFSSFSQDTVLPDVMLNNICFDSREVSVNSAFVALGSVAGNRNEYIAKALDAGAALVLFDPAEGEAVIDERCFAIQDLKQQIGHFLHNWFGQVTHQLSMIGITGTNGKSSVSFYVSQILDALNKPCAVMGTLGYGRPDNLTETGMTTLPLEKLHGALAELSEEYQAVAMEVSSHGLHQNRLAGVAMSGAVYTNLSHDHLDYHGDMNEYAAAKALLFKRPELNFAVINGDDEYASVMSADSSAKSVLTYGQQSKNDLVFSVDSIGDEGIALTIRFENKMSQALVPLYGAFNAYNAIAALGVALQLGFSFDESVKALGALKSVAGRMERVSDDVNLPLVLVDYAHTPDALEQVLNTSQQHCKGSLTVVVGCGGDRDQRKRPLMGEIAARYADSVIFTSDNPRSESPAAIADQMVASLSHTQYQNKYQIELDRERAIRHAIKGAKTNDLVLIAGKGHEDYQEINGQRSYFSDIAVARAVLEERP